MLVGWHHHKPPALNLSGLHSKDSVFKPPHDHFAKWRVRRFQSEERAPQERASKGAARPPGSRDHNRASANFMESFPPSMKCLSLELRQKADKADKNSPNPRRLQVETEPCSP